LCPISAADKLTAPRGLCLPRVLGVQRGAFELDEDEHGELPDLTLTVFDDLGQVEESSAPMTVVGTRPATVAGGPYRVAFAIPFMTIARSPTVMKARLTTADRDLEVITCAIVGGVPDALPDDLG
jgi:hypothetical protein